MHLLLASPPGGPRRSTAAHARALEQEARAVIARHFPDAAELYSGKGWELPNSIDRIYDAALAEQELDFRCETDFAAVLCALRGDKPLRFAHDAGYVSPGEVVVPH